MLMHPCTSAFPALVIWLVFSCTSHWLLLAEGATHMHMEQALPFSSHGYKRLFRAQHSQQHSVIFAVRQKNERLLEQLLYNVSTPGAAAYGQFLSAREVAEIADTQQSSDAVLRYLQDCGCQVIGSSSASSDAATTAAGASGKLQQHRTLAVQHISPHGGAYITATGSIACWEHVFNASFFVHQQHHEDSNPGTSAITRSTTSAAPPKELWQWWQQQERPRPAFVTRAQRYSLPVELSSHVDAVFNTVHFPPKGRLEAPRRTRAAADNSTATRRMLAAGKAGFQPTLVAGKAGFPSIALLQMQLQQERGKPNEFNSITPSVLESYYNIDPSIGNGLASQAVYETVGQYFSPSDVRQFHAAHGVPEQEEAAITQKKFKSDGKCKKKPERCTEGNLDIMYIQAVGQDTPTTFWYVNAEDSFLGWILQIAAEEEPPLVNVIAYGSNEEDVPKSYMKKFNLEAMKLGLRGVSILASSGDDGAPGFKARDGDGSGSQCNGYQPTFPASMPFVTAVGATAGAEEGNAEETVCSSREGNSATSGGGFSNAFKQPAYQKAAVKAYLKTHVKKAAPDQRPVPGFNSKGRAYPDISMAGNRYEMVIGGENLFVSGTSASAPVMSGVVSLVNSARLAAGRAPLGFLNPALYALAAADRSGAVIKDVTLGDNRCTAAGDPAVACGCSEGFEAVPGFDPATGLGTVNDFDKFLNALLAV